MLSSFECLGFRVFDPLPHASKWFRVLVLREKKKKKGSVQAGVILIGFHAAENLCLW